MLSGPGEPPLEHRSSTVALHADGVDEAQFPLMTNEHDSSNTSDTNALDRSGVHELTIDDIDAVGRSLARAFETDPIWKFLTGDRFDDFATRAAGFFAAEARNRLRHHGSLVTGDGYASALWGPPNHWKTGLVDVARLAPSSLRLFGTKVVQALSVLEEVDKHHPTEPHWYLAFLGTDPVHQGKGLGSSVLRPVLDRCDHDEVPAYLESSKESNVPFYERHGFEVTGTVDLAKGKGPRMWLMWREPQLPES